MEYILPSIVALASCGLLWWLIKELLTAKGQQGSLQAQISFLQNQNSQYVKRISEIEKQNTNLLIEISKYTHKDEILRNYRYNEVNGIFVHIGDGRAYCPKCLDQLKEKMLKIETSGWRCTTCNAYYPNPNLHGLPGLRAIK